jgi:hypothetical protein
MPGDSEGGKLDDDILNDSHQQISLVSHFFLDRRGRRDLTWHEQKSYRERGDSTS